MLSTHFRSKILVLLHDLMYYHGHVKQFGGYAMKNKAIKLEILFVDSTSISKPVKIFELETSQEKYGVCVYHSLVQNFNRPKRLETISATRFWLDTVEDFVMNIKSDDCTKEYDFYGLQFIFKQTSSYY